jgi:DNA-binding CsgD family transcriptional regulator
VFGVVVMCEREVLSLLSQGKVAKEIADELD